MKKFRVKLSFMYQTVIEADSEDDALEMGMVQATESLNEDGWQEQEVEEV